MPYTLLIDSEGEIVYRKVGVVDPGGLLKKSLDTLMTYHTTPIRKAKAK